MFSVYDLTCNGMRDPMGTHAPFRLSWCLGSDEAGFDQTSYRLRVTSMESGESLWDSGWVESSDNEVVFYGDALEPGEIGIWFVEAKDTVGVKVCSIPGCFQKAYAGGAEATDEFCNAIFTSSEPDFDCEYADPDLSFLREDATWAMVLGLDFDSVDERLVHIEPHLPEALSFAQGSIIASRGLVVERLSRYEDQIMLEVTLAPGMRAEVVCGDEERLIDSGHHVLTWDE